MNTCSCEPVNIAQLQLGDTIHPWIASCKPEYWLVVVLKNIDFGGKGGSATAIGLLPYTPQAVKMRLLYLSPFTTQVHRVRL